MDCQMVHREKWLTSNSLTVVNLKQCWSKTTNTFWSVAIPGLLCILLPIGHSLKVTRKQFPHQLCWATTIHKIQSATLTKIAISFQWPLGQGKVTLLSVTQTNWYYLSKWDNITDDNANTHRVDGRHMILPQHSTACNWHGLAMHVTSKYTI